MLTFHYAGCPESNFFTSIIFCFDWSREHFTDWQSYYYDFYYRSRRSQNSLWSCLRQASTLLNSTNAKAMLNQLAGSTMLLSGCHRIVANINASFWTFFRHLAILNWRTTHVIFEPLDFISKLASLVPKPRVNLTRFHGVFVGMPHHPNSKHRTLVTPARRSKKRQIGDLKDNKTDGERQVAMTWAQRLKRVFNSDV